jgi:hypothetical protein
MKKNLVLDLAYAEQILILFLCSSVQSEHATVLFSLRAQGFFFRCRWSSLQVLGLAGFVLFFSCRSSSPWSHVIRSMIRPHVPVSVQQVRRSTCLDFPFALVVPLRSYRSAVSPSLGLRAWPPRPRVTSRSAVR